MYIVYPYFIYMYIILHIILYFLKRARCFNKLIKRVLANKSMYTYLSMYIYLQNNVGKVIPTL